MARRRFRFLPPYNTSGYLAEFNLDVNPGDEITVDLPDGAEMHPWFQALDELPPRRSRKTESPAAPAPEPEPQEVE